MASSARLQSSPPPRGAHRAQRVQAIDISATADRAVGMLNAGQIAEAVTLIQTARTGQSQAVQDALDRYVRARSRKCYAAPSGSAPGVAAALARIDMAGIQPQMPIAEQVALLGEAQQHDVYASIVETQGARAATDALVAGDRVILGLRQDQSTLVNKGRGAYSDRIVVLDRDGPRHAAIFARANTQPTAQYDANQASNRAIHHAHHYDGQDVTGDGVPELGRLAEGTYGMLVTTHANPRSAGTDFAFRPTAATIAGGANRVERDSNHDGLFTTADPNRLTALDRTFKIHSGSFGSTDSSGCQTIAPDDFRRFQRATEHPRQTVWQYVLVKVRP